MTGPGASRRPAGRGGRAHRPSRSLAVTTFGTAADAEAMITRIRKIHERVRGIAPDGRPYAASDPHLLRWVHVAEVDSFLAAHQRYGANPLDAAGCDRYAADVAGGARARRPAHCPAGGGAAPARVRARARRPPRPAGDQAVGPKGEPPAGRQVRD